jgi:hypothetical protein
LLCTVALFCTILLLQNELQAISIVEEEHHEQNDVAVHKDAEVLLFMHREKEEVKRRLLEVVFLEMLSIHVHDSMLALVAERVRVLPQLTRMAEFHWSKLYDSKSHK